MVWFPSSEEEESDHDASFRWDHTGAGGSELPVVMEKGRSDSESVAPVPLTDEDELQFEDVSGKSAPLRGYAEEGDDLSQDGDQESMYDGEDQSTVLSSSAGLHSSSCYEVSVPSLSEYVFLSPTWLNRAIKGVMDRRAMEAFEADRLLACMLCCSVCQNSLLFKLLTLLYVYTVVLLQEERRSGPVQLPEWGGALGLGEALPVA